jgi:hypothetical protein
MLDLFTDSGAIFSPCEGYRGLLWRSWDRQKPMLGCIWLNPSTATAEINDPTVTRGINRARAMGYGGLMVGNIFTLRATDPHELRLVDDPIGPAADKHLLQLCGECEMVICGWGFHGVLPGRSGRPRSDEVVDLLVGAGHALHALRLTVMGQPGHPLYLPSSLEPFLWMDRDRLAARSAIVGEN